MLKKKVILWIALLSNTGGIVLHTRVLLGHPACYGPRAAIPLMMLCLLVVVLSARDLRKLPSEPYVSLPKKAA